MSRTTYHFTEPRYAQRADGVTWTYVRQAAHGRGGWAVYLVRKDGIENLGFVVRAGAGLFRAANGTYYGLERAAVSLATLRLENEIFAETAR